MSNIDYKEAVFFRKKEYNLNGFNEMIVKAADLIALNDEKDVHAVCEGMLKNMLEGDRILSGEDNLYTEDLTIAYYCDNLSESRRRLY